MALARIITRFPKSSQSLAAELKARGFEVQTGSPDAITREFADLEFRIEECSAEEALRRATQFGEAGTAVFIAPEAITPEMAPMAVLPFFQELVQPQSTANHHTTSNFEAPKPLESQGELIESGAEEPATAGEAPALELSAPMAVESGSQAVALSAVEAQSELPENVPTMSFENKNRALPEDICLQGETFRAETKEASPEQTQPEELPIEAEPVDTLRLPDAAGIPAQAEFFELQQSNDTRSQENEAERERQSLPSWSVEATNAEELPSAVVDDRQRENDSLRDPKQAANVAADSEPLAVQSAEPTSDWPIWNPPNDVVASVAKQDAAGSLESEGASFFDGAWAEHQSYSVAVPFSEASLMPDAGSNSEVGDSGMLARRFSGEDQLFWKTAALAAMFALVALLLGSFAHRISPIPPGLVQRSEPEQQAPLLKSKHNASPSEGNRVLLTVSEPAETKSPDRVEAITPASQTHRTQSQASLASSKQQESTKQKARSAETNAGFVAEDTVVRFGDRVNPGSLGTARPAKTEQKSEVRRYSDLN
jgi:hypothetical protein